MEPIYIIAEAGVNHNGSIDMAKQLIDVASEVGANAVKFQTFKAGNNTSQKAPKAEYQLKTTNTNESQLNMLKKLELSQEDHHSLIEHCNDKHIQFLSTPFDLESLDLLTKTLQLPKLKLPSGDITNAPLLLKAAQSARPLILSTGMSSLSDIETALGVIAFGYTQQQTHPSLEAFHKAYCSDLGQQALKDNVVLLHCTTEYPAPFQDVNLRTMATLRAAFGLPVGYSDHTPGIVIPIAAAALGAVVIEKHFTLDRQLPGPDHKASLEPKQLEAMVCSIRQVERAMGQSIKRPASSELKNKEIARKSLMANTLINKGELFTVNNLVAKRPGTGISPIYFWDLLGKIAEQDYKQDEMIKT